MSYEEETEDRDLEPGADVTPKLFRQWQKARRGLSPAEEMTNPVWCWLFRGRVDPYHANERFKSLAAKFFTKADYPSEPRWAGCRMGQSRTRLSDGRTFWIAGEHEDYYDPDFYIYNDVIVEDRDGNVRIYGYPESNFRPTDFHSATPIHDEKTLLIIGSIGYSDERIVGRTPIYALNTQSLAIEEVASTGPPPGWISRHRATLSEDATSIIITGGEVLTDNGFIESIDDWSLSLSDFRWARLTKREWTRFQVRRIDNNCLHLWQYDMRKFALDHPNAHFDREDDLANDLGAEPNMEAYASLYAPAISHSPIERDLDNDDDWRTKKLTIEGVLVRYTDCMNHLRVTIEGELPRADVETLAEDLRGKLQLVENAKCQLEWID